MGGDSERNVLERTSFERWDLGVDSFSHEHQNNADTLPPLVFEPYIHRALWGGRQLQSILGKKTGGHTDVAESWEVCDLPGYQTTISDGPYQGQTISQLLESNRKSLLGRHSDREYFPLLLKFLDAKRRLSLQVHPKHPTLQADGTTRPGKAECWVVLHAEESSRIALGLKSEVTPEILNAAIEQDRVEDCVHFHFPKVGECIFISPGVVHALGEGILVAEIQEPSDITYRLHDWGRRDHQGRLRELHLEQAMNSTCFETGPVQPVSPSHLDGTEKSEVLVESEYFIVHRHRGPQCWQMPEDDRMHIFVVLEGELRRCSSDLNEQIYPKGTTVVLPASRADDYWLFDQDAIILDVFLP